MSTFRTCLLALLILPLLLTVPGLVSADSAEAKNTRITKDAARARSVLVTGDACVGMALGEGPVPFTRNLVPSARCATVHAGGCKHTFWRKTHVRCNAEFTVTVRTKGIYFFCTSPLYWKGQDGLIVLYRRPRWNCEQLRLGQGIPTSVRNAA